jgi:hypothetical protein
MQQPPAAGLAYLIGGRRQRRVAELEVTKQTPVDRAQVGQADAAPLDMQGVDENPATTGVSRDGYRVLQRGDGPVGHELDQRADTIRLRRLDEPGERVGQPGQVGILADGVDVLGAELGR